MASLRSLSSSAPTADRWMIAVAGAAVMLTIGTIYSWAIFTQPLLVAYGWSLTSTTWAYAIANFSLAAVGAVIGGFWQDRVGPRRVALIGVTLWGCGNVLAGLGIPFFGAPCLYVSYGALGGIGAGMAYITPLAMVTKWFPDKKGLAGGLVAGAFGLGAFIYNQVVPRIAGFHAAAVHAGGYIAARAAAQAAGETFDPSTLTVAQTLSVADIGAVMRVFVVSGLIFLIVGVAGASRFRNPPSGYTPPGRPRAAPTPITDGGYSPAQILAMPQFYLLWLQLFVNVIAGITIISNAAFILADLTKLSAASIAPLFGLASIFNALGRCFWGAISDRIGCNHTFAAMFAVQAATVLVLAHVHGLVPALGAVSVILLCCGGGFGMMPSFNARCFGTKFMGLNYGLILSAWGFAGLIGPLLIARGKDLTGSFEGMLPFIAIVLAISVMLPYLTKRPPPQPGDADSSSNLVPTIASAPVAASFSTRTLRSFRATGRGLAALILVSVTAGFGSCSGGGGGGPHYVLQGSISGLLPGHSVVLQNYGSDSTTVSANGSFEFSRPLPGGAPYSVTVLTQPSGETCATVNGSGTGTVGPGVNVDVACTVGNYVVNLEISGLGTSTLVLEVNNNTVSIEDTGGSPTFPLSLSGNWPIGTPYAVSVASQPLGEDCTVGNGGGTATTSAVNVVINCVAASYTIGGTVTGLSGGSLLGLQDNGGSGGNITTVSASGNFHFATPLPAGGPYSVTVSGQPATESCVVTHGSGTVPEANVTTIAVACTVTGYEINLEVNGLNGTLVAQLNGIDLHFTDTAGGAAITVTAFQPIGTPYALTVTSQPQGQYCAVTNGSGPGTSNANVVINCVASYTIGGTVSGLSAGNSVVLKDNGGNATTVSANGPFTFSAAIANQSPYAVTVSTQPTGESCSVSNGSGTVAGANVTHVAILCTSTVAAGLWTWESGSNTPDYIGVYGTLGAAAPGNTPGGREAAFSWTDSTGNLWMFGGIGAGNSGVGGSFNDLWRYSPNTGVWAWMSGADTLDALSVYGTKGTPAPGNVPSARSAGVAWTDGAGDLWMFGGGGFDSTGSNDLGLSDLWRYSPSAGMWTWMNGPTVGNLAGVYGTLGTAAPGNVPGGRTAMVSFEDSAGNFWLFGGAGFDSIANGNSSLNDLWRYSPSTGMWTWMGGSNHGNAAGVYGTQGTAAAANVPGARGGAVSWTDGGGNFWLFGGRGYDSAGNVGVLNDLWRYRPSTGEWTWMSGSMTVGAAGVYGTLGTAAAGNVPGARQDAAAWIDSAGNLWLFGDGTFDSNGDLISVGNDLWRYTPSTGLWTWMGGSTVQGAPGVYGTLGIAAAGNVPGGRDIGAPFIDGSGNLWLFGGYVPAGALNDLWKYVPPVP